MHREIGEEDIYYLKRHNFDFMSKAGTENKLSQFELFAYINKLELDKTSFPVSPTLHCLLGCAYRYLEREIPFELKDELETQKIDLLEFSNYHYFFGEREIDKRNEINNGKIYGLEKMNLRAKILNASISLVEDEVKYYSKLNNEQRMELNYIRGLNYGENKTSVYNSVLIPLTYLLPQENRTNIYGKVRNPPNHFLKK